MSKSIHLFLCMCLLLVSLTSCKNTKEEDAKHTVATETSSTNSGDFSDGEVAGTMISFNKTSVVFGDLGVTSAQHKVVKQLATELRDTFLSAAEKAYQKAQSEGFEIRDHKLTQGLMKRSGSLLQMLKRKSKQDFDKVYLKVLRDTFAQNLEIINGKLIPECQSSEYRTFLQENAEIYKRYLDEVSKVLESL